MRLFAVHLVGDDRLDVVAQQTGAPVVGVIGLVGEKVSRPRQMRGEHDGALDVGGLAGREIEGQGPAMFVAQGMDLGVASALCAADGLSRGPPFPPPAQRCALTWVVSMETCSGVPARLSVKAASRYCQ